MKKYYIYDTALAPAELLAKHPKPAIYETISLFVEGGENPTGIVDIASMGFNHPYDENGVGLTALELDTMVDGVSAPEPPPTTDEVQLSRAQAKYLYETRFKPTEVVE